jgi:hypothetical protein
LGTKLIVLASSAWLTKLRLIGGSSEAERKHPPLRVRRVKRKAKLIHECSQTPNQMPRGNEKNTMQNKNN